MRALALALAVSLAVDAALAQHAPPKPLFDGKTLAGFMQRGGKAKYAVESGEIVGRAVPNSPNSFLCTEREYADFILDYEFKVDPKLNSGVQIRSHSFPGYRDGVVHGLQVEIDPSERAFTAGIYEEQGRGWLADLKDNEAARKAFKQGEWNHVRVEARGPSVKTWLNGVAAATLTDERAQRGFIGLQVHSVEGDQPLEVRWRNLNIQDFGDPHASAPKGAVVLLDSDGGTSAWEKRDKPDTRIEWVWKDDALEVKPGSGDIVTRQSFGSARIHVEFAVDDNGKQGQANGNSGVYIQRRYELQILNSAGQAPADDICGGIYKTAVPAENAALPAGAWQTYDILFTAAKFDDAGKKTANARASVWHNGVRIHDNVGLPDKTGGGNPEGPTDGPILLQDHGNKIRFRNIWVAPA